MDHMAHATLPLGAYVEGDAVGIGLDVAVIVAIGVLAVWLGSPLVQAIFRRVDRPRSPSARLHDGHREPDGPPTRPSVVAAGQILRGGTWIGGLERLAVYASVLTGWKEGIAVVLAIKGLARYPELTGTTSAAAERFIIGTFVSVLLAVGCAGAAYGVASLT